MLYVDFTNYNGYISGYYDINILCLINNNLI